VHDGSIAGRGAFVGGSCYGATKAFVTSWSESLMLEVRDHGVKVSVVMPGSVDDALQRARAVGRGRVEADRERRRGYGGVRRVDAANVLVHRAEVRTLTVPKGRAR
jgi:short-subunit dehydrogenase